MASKTWKLGVIGYGLSAKTFHIPFIEDVPELKLYAVVQRTPKPDDDAEKDHPGIKSYRTAEELIKDEGVDVVVITTGPDSHFELAKAALEAGKHGELMCYRASFPAFVLLLLTRVGDMQWFVRSLSPLPPRKPTSSLRSPRRRTGS